MRNRSGLDIEDILQRLFEKSSNVNNDNITVRAQCDVLSVLEARCTILCVIIPFVQLTDI